MEHAFPSARGRLSFVCQSLLERGSARGSYFFVELADFNADGVLNFEDFLSKLVTWIEFCGCSGTQTNGCGTLLGCPWLLCSPLLNSGDQLAARCKMVRSHVPSSQKLS